MLDRFKKFFKKDEEKEEEKQREIENEVLENIGEPDIEKLVTNEEVVSNDTLEEVLNEDNIKNNVEEKDLNKKEENSEKEKLGFFEKLKNGLNKTRDGLKEQFESVLLNFKTVDAEFFEYLEEILITSDVGIETTLDLIDALEEKAKRENIKEPEEIIEALKDEITKYMEELDLDHELNIKPEPGVILVVGVNGVGKTTTIGKLANKFRKDGKSVLIAAGDTFRAAAIEQLEEWGNRANVNVIKHSEGADPGAVIFDGIQAAKSRNIDILICDTAGRLHNKANLMNELNKIFNIVDREYPNATKEILLVLDATTGQNAMIQARTFKDVADITGIALTKLDGTAKGGVVIGLQSELNIPIKLIGVGEGIEDLQEFNSRDFINALFEETVDK